MAVRRCPGSLKFAQPQIQVLPCPDCGTDTEIWSDEATGTCPQCGRSVIRTGTTSCLDWCQYAEECLGKEGFRRYGEMKAELLRAALVRLVAARLAEDPQAGERCRRAAAFAEAIAAHDSSLPPPLLIPIALGIVLLAAAGPRAPVAATLQPLLQEAGYAPETAAQILSRLGQWAAGAGGDPVLDAAVDAVALAAHPKGRADAARLRTAAARWVAAELA